MRCWPHENRYACHHAVGDCAGLGHPALHHLADCQAVEWHTDNPPPDHPVIKPCAVTNSDASGFTFTIGQFSRRRLGRTVLLAARGGANQLLLRCNNSATLASSTFGGMGLSK